jgi:DNA topoisomerase-1
VTKSLVIVESPAKAKTIAGYLGADYVVESSIGHVRDLPRNAADVPAAYKHESWARLGIDVDNDFKPLYVISPDRRDQIKKLKALLKDADQVFLATDEDREGEAIAWHLLEVLNPRVPVKRMVFHEITPTAIRAAIESPRELDRRLVDAQEARRLLDRLYGYEVSPVLWKKVMPRLSAGRVQSVATRIVVERERERMRFRAASYWDLTAVFDTAVAAASGAKADPAAGPTTFGASLVEVDAKRVATGRDFASDGAVSARSADSIVVLDEAGATALAEGLRDRPFSVRSVEPKPYRRRPAAPFMTSTFQQEAARKLRLSAAQAMRTAQSLYEKGYITYMRTDSTTLSEAALNAARATIRERFGAQYLPSAPRTYAKKVKNAQEAHEAIRPSGDRFRSPDDVARELPSGEARVYELIWQRTVASQMTDAEGETIVARVAATATDGRDAVFQATGTVITHAGFRRVYVEDVDEGEEGDTEERRLPALTQGQSVAERGVTAEGHTTQPPARYTEASLVRRLEELGVGRPSTYASIMGTIQDRGYVWKKGTALVPSFTAFSVVTLLELHFPDLVDYEFTARMEDDLDNIAGGHQSTVPWLTRFYFGVPTTGDHAHPEGSREGKRDLGLKKLVSEHLGEIDARAVNSIPLGVSADGEAVVVRVGKYGPYIQCGERSASIPDDFPPDELTIDRAMEFIDAPAGDRVVGTDPVSGLEVMAKAGRFGPYVQLGIPEEGSKERPRTASLFKDDSIETIDLEHALQLLSLPRVVGVDPGDGAEIVAANGRYGPYINKAGDSRSLTTEAQLLSITLEEALVVLAEPKRRRGQGTAAGPLRTMGADPVSGKEMVVKEGRFGPYVTDGETNASLRKGDDVEELTDERAAELLADRRARGPVAKKSSRGAKKAPAKKTAAKKATAKKAPSPMTAKTVAKKSPAKKAAAKKAAPKTAMAAEAAATEAPASEF